MTGSDRINSLSVDGMPLLEASLHGSSLSRRTPLPIFIFDHDHCTTVLREFAACLLLACCSLKLARLKRAESSERIHTCVLRCSEVSFPA